MKISKYLVILLLCLAAFLRLYHLGSNPPGLTADEASLGYNAYSILRTGKDEYGTTLPIIFKSFGDYKPGIYVYLTIPSILILNFTEFAVRLPSALAGILSVYLLYLLAKKLFANQQLSLATLFVAATNPWLIYFSRGAWEVNLSLALTLAGIYLFLLSLQKQKYIFLSAIFFALTLIAYQGAKLTTIVILLILAMIYWRELIRFKLKYLFGSTLLGLVLALPIILSLFTGQTGRLKVFSVFSYPRSSEYIQTFLSEANISKGSLEYDMFYNEPVNFARGILERLFNNFSARFLFFEGDWANPRHTPPYQGVLVLGDALFLLIGVFSSLRSNSSKGRTLVFLWLILAPLPAILSRDQVQAVRSLQLAVPFVFIISFGICYVLTNYKRTIVWGIGLIYLITYLYFLESYFVQQPKLNLQYWDHGYKQVVEQVSPIQSNYKRVIVQASYDQPYIYFLFYQKYDPTKWQIQAYLTQKSGADVGLVEHLDNICFCDIDWTIDRGDHGDLIVADTKTVPPTDSYQQDLFPLIAEVKYLNDRYVLWRILEVK